MGALFLHFCCIILLLGLILQLLQHEKVLGEEWILYMFGNLGIVEILFIEICEVKFGISIDYFH